jgi:hypothetical protein
VLQPEFAHLLGAERFVRDLLGAGPPPLALTLRLTREAAEALDYARGPAG